MVDHTTDDIEQIPEKMKAVLIARGIRRGDFAKTLAPILGISVPQAYRKLNGVTAMTLAQVETFNSHFGIQIMMDPAPQLTELNAIFRVGQIELPCVIELGTSTIGLDYAKRYAAFDIDGTWYVSDAKVCPPGATLREVESIALTQTRSIAVLDDDRGTADNLRDYLVAKGYKALAFYDADATMTSINASRFDGYFLDWRLADETSEKLIKFIREIQPDAPIIVSTAGGADGLEHQAVLAELEKQYRVACHMKPMTMKLLTSIMADALAKKVSNANH